DSEKARKEADETREEEKKVVYETHKEVEEYDEKMEERIEDATDGDPHESLSSVLEDLAETGNRSPPESSNR
ncbi:hypothetical protein DF186_25210, partial [Enterococcus hirae]